MAILAAVIIWLLQYALRHLGSAFWPVLFTGLLMLTALAVIVRGD
jgi:hypothetical protein